MQPSPPADVPVASVHTARWTTGLLLKSFYFFVYGTIGCYIVFFPPYLRGLGFSGDQLSLMGMTCQAAAVASTLGWAALADRLQAANRVLRLCTLLAFVSILFLPWAKTPLQIAAVIVIHHMAGPALVPLVDSVASEWLQRRQLGSYSRTRLFGTLGGLLIVQSLGSLLSARGELPGDPAVPYFLVALVTAYTAVAQFLPFAPPADRKPELRDVRALSQDGSLRLLLLVCFVHWLSNTPYDLLFGVFLRDQGLPSSFTGVGSAASALAEVLMMAAFPLLERRLRIGSLLALTFAGTALRWGLLSLSTSVVAIAALQLLHGAMFGLFWATVIKTISTIVPSRLRTTGLALFSAVVVSGGNTIGFRLSGLGYDKLGAAPLFGYAALLEIVALMLVLAVGRRFTPRESVSSAS